MEGINLTDDQVVALDAIAAGVVGLRVVMVNVFGIQGSGGWLLVDAGLPGSAGRIQRWAQDHFGGRPPLAILLTHAHFDHVGALDTLLDAWNVPVYAHEEELPYLTGVRSYPPPDPSVGGGIMARMASLYPRGPIDVGMRAQALPSEGRVPELPDWQWLHTPGHSAGHVSFFRKADHTLVVGDAFCTTRQESFLAVATQRPELHGPPAYFTTDWDVARDSVERLAAMAPMHIAPGHGQPMGGTETAEALQALAAEFDTIARPAEGRYVERPQRW
jgi:glyoxylase-like metal-dependent hydrolase (beta-lactamase superfamily II)